MKPFEFHPSARAELLEAVRRYDRARPGLGDALLDAVQTAARFVRERPQAGTPVRGGLRRWLTRRFPYSVIYRDEPLRIFIVAVAHQRRRPSYWRART